MFCSGLDPLASIYGVGITRAAIHAASHVANAPLHPTNAGTAAIWAPKLNEKKKCSRINNSEMVNKNSQKMPLRKIIRNDPVYGPVETYGIQKWYLIKEKLLPGIVPKVKPAAEKHATTSAAQPIFFTKKEYFSIKICLVISGPRALFGTARQTQKKKIEKLLKKNYRHNIPQRQWGLQSHSSS